MTRILLTAFVIAGALSGAESLRFENRHVEQKIAGCGDEKDGCAHADFTYVELVSGPANVRERINAAIRDAIVSRPNDGLKLTPEEYAAHFVAGYEKVRGETKGYDQRWSLTKSVKVLRTAAPMVCLEYSEWSYTGGAHGNFATLYLDFDALTGETMKLSGIVKEGSLPRLTAVAEAYFRKERQLSPSANLKDAGFSFPDGRFQLSDSFGMSEKDLIFQYNSYDVAPYSMGPTTVTIPLSEIRDLLQ